MIFFITAKYGGFIKISPEIKECRSEILVYKKITGDFDQRYKASKRIFQKLIRDTKILSCKSFVIYYENPKHTGKFSIPYDIGCMLDPYDLKRKEEICTDFNITEFPAGKYLVAEFPYINRISISLGILKVFPVLDHYAKNHGYKIDTPVLEIWDVPQNKIIYRKVLIKENVGGDSTIFQER